MDLTHLPILYSFRRCPYAMRARLALRASGVSCQLREISLKNKPDAFLSASPSATVPCLVHEHGTLDESLDIMKWALAQHDPRHWLDMPQAGWDWIARADGPFKTALDRCKYAVRYPDEDPLKHRADAALFLEDLDQTIGTYIFNTPSIADYAIAPFVRQFAFIDFTWFSQQPWPKLQLWLDRFINSDDFGAIMHKYPVWAPEDAPVMFP